MHDYPEHVEDQLEYVLQRLEDKLQKDRSKRLSFWTYEQSKAKKDTTVFKTTVLSDRVDFDTCVDYVINLGKNFTIGLDVEASSEKAHEALLHGIGLYIKELDEAFYIVFDLDVSNPQYRKENNFDPIPTSFVEPIHKLCKWLYFDNRVQLANALYDLTVLYRYNKGLLPAIFDDCFIQAYLLGIKTPKLSTLAGIFLDRYPQSFTDLIKGKTSLWELPVQKVADYCGEDCYESVMLCEKFEHDIRLQGLQQLYKLERDVVAPLVKAKVLGITLDVEQVDNLWEDFEDERRFRQLRLNKKAKQLSNGRVEELNVKSSQQLSDFLFVYDLKLPTEYTKKGKSGAYSCDVKVLANCVPYHPVVQDIIDLRDIRGSKALGKLKEFKKNVTDQGTLHCDFNVTNTETGRLSSSNPNLQNVSNPDNNPKWGPMIRNLLIAREGYVLVACDYSQFELRILAHLSQDESLLAAYNKGLDLHSFVTVSLAEKLGLYDIDQQGNRLPIKVLDPDNIKDHKRARTFCKRVNFGTVYGMGPTKFVSLGRELGYNWDIEWAEAFLKDYWRTLPGVYRYFCWLRLHAVLYGYVETILGRRRRFLFRTPLFTRLLHTRESTKQAYLSNPVKAWETLTADLDIYPEDEGNFRQAQNLPVQGSNADLIKVAMVNCYSLFNFDECRLLLQVHDELVFEVLQTKVEYYKQLIEQLMVKAANILCVPVIAEAKTNRLWGECK